MRGLMLILVVAVIPLSVTAGIFSPPDPFDLGVKNLARLVRATIFTERQIRIKKTKPGGCAIQVKGPLSYDESQKACLDCVRILNAALRAQGFAKADIRYASIGMLTPNSEIFTGNDPELDGHVFTLLRMKDREGKWRLIFFDPSLPKYATIWAKIGWRPIGQEILSELSRYGFWMVNESRYRFFTEQWKEYSRGPHSILDFAKLPTLFDYPEAAWVRHSDPKAPWRKLDLEKELRKIGLIDLLHRFGDDQTVLRFVKEWSNESYSELDQELEEGIIPDETPGPTQILPKQ